jgi:hypothetical protein
MDAGLVQRVRQHYRPHLESPGRQAIRRHGSERDSRSQDQQGRRRFHLQTAGLFRFTVLAFLCTVIVVVMIAPPSAFAEGPADEAANGSPNPNPNPNDGRPEISSPAAPVAVAAAAPMLTAAQPVSLPDAPAPQHRVIDKKFIAVMAALGGAESLRFTTHQLVLVHEFAAGAPWVTSVPQNHRLVAKYGAIYAAELLVTYELKKPHSWLPGDKVIRKLWWVYPAAMAPIHIMNGVRSIRTQAPSSCPVELCQQQ